ncbi:hypothetical protein PTSG_05759 [Salpingoeca rosetta]|uniref:Phosphoglycerate mutase n=1 Tax=Salpingoeca rosetta (strain ATCC 50818 / BSB-021) TaxID=946362 RepID=F2UB54_SALR5|nr:uncharacterized protein PTSG_05759 [Salpingoeca rosetta]EGD74067.1 hypothetical protein PTSG_05759 [Salpingoeca rosetta]|eukprot:XP_004993629.1 hypothetical protein PTSG_05759 [Salpingoeca rosetta]
MMMAEEETRLILVRHGETTWNVERRLQGHRDVDLNEKGKQQAMCVARALQDRHVHAVYSSDLKRAHDTARHITDIHPTFSADNIVRDPALRERCLGILEGHTRMECALHFPEVIGSMGEPDFELEGGESLAEFAGRVTTALDRIAANHQGETVLVVTHGGALNVALTHILQLPFGRPRRFAISNASINEFTWHPTHGWHLETWNSVVHLQDDHAPLRHVPSNQMKKLSE